MALLKTSEEVKPTQGVTDVPHSYPTAWSGERRNTRTSANRGWRPRLSVERRAASGAGEVSDAPTSEASKGFAKMVQLVCVACRRRPPRHLAVRHNPSLKERPDRNV